MTSSDVSGDGAHARDYALQGVLVHSGTANGGHYKAFVKSPKNVWYEYDDANVSEYRDGEVDKLFWHTCSSPNGVNAIISEDSMMKKMSIYEGVYMLVYQATDSAVDCSNLVIPREISEEIAVANNRVQLLRKANEVHKLMTEIVCYKVMSVDGSTHVNSSAVALPPCTLYVIGTNTLQKTTQQIFEYFCTNNVLNSSEYAVDRCRLRRYNNSSRMFGETFTGKEHMTLGELGLFPSCSLALEVLSTGASFTDFNSKELQLRLLEYKMDSNEENDDSKEDLYVSVGGDDFANVGNLRSKAAKAFNASDDQIVIIKNDGKSNFEDLCDNSILLSTCNVHSGDDIVICVLPTGIKFSENEKSEEVLRAYRSKKRDIKIFYNNLNGSKGQSDDTDGNASSGVEYNNFVVISIDATLGDLKQLIAQNHNISIEKFHLRRNAAAPQLTHLNKSLDSIGFVDQSIIHVKVFSLYSYCNSYQLIITTIIMYACRRVKNMLLESIKFDVMSI
jgi:hypothetical protein